VRAASLIAAGTRTNTSRGVVGRSLRASARVQLLRVALEVALRGGSVRAELAAEGPLARVGAQVLLEQEFLAAYLAAIRARVRLGGRVKVRL